uniref:KRAB domain-containing protein n=1 Tax=Spermophilus dauricus TaxID=99837 RepID=A0A8C9PP13_SPEDA
MLAASFLSSLSSFLLIVDKEGYVTLEDAYVYFSWEEWELLVEVQRFLNRNVMLENFALMTMLGCWYNADNEETFFCMRSPESGGHSITEPHSQTFYSLF